MKLKTFLMEKVSGESRNSIWKRSDTGEIFQNRSVFPVGAVYRATWYEEEACRNAGWCAPDGTAYVVVIPDKIDESGHHHWHIDGRASNCTKPEDRVHKCWCRHGNAPNFQVDKNGNTCNAGAGSIIAPGGWHGFLHDGYLHD